MDVAKKGFNCFISGQTELTMNSEICPKHLIYCLFRQDEWVCAWASSKMRGSKDLCEKILSNNMMALFFTYVLYHEQAFNVCFFTVWFLRVFMSRQCNSMCLRRTERFYWKR